jgi:hypothetical protein
MPISCHRTWPLAWCMLLAIIAPDVLLAVIALRVAARSMIRHQKAPVSMTQSGQPFTAACFTMSPVNKVLQLQACHTGHHPSCADDGQPLQHCCYDSTANCHNSTPWHTLAHTGPLAISITRTSQATAAGLSTPLDTTSTVLKHC